MKGIFFLVVHLIFLQGLASKLSVICWKDLRCLVVPNHHQEKGQGRLWAVSELWLCWWSGMPRFLAGFVLSRMAEWWL